MLAISCKWRAAAAVAEAVTVAVAAGVAGVAEAAVVAAAVADPAVRLGVSAASAKTRAHPDHIEKRDVMAGSDQVDPAKSCQPSPVSQVLSSLWHRHCVYPLRIPATA